MKKYAFLLIAISLMVFSGCRKDAPSSPKEGAPAPDFTLESLSGGKIRLSDLRGKVLLLNFWASWCPPCREEIPSLYALNAAMSGKNFQLLTVSIDKGGKDTLTVFFDRIGVKLPTLLDPDGSVGRIYGITGVPETFVIDRQGIIRKKIVGPIDWNDPSVISYLDGLTN